MFPDHQLGWASEVATLIKSDELARDVQGSEEILDKHQELKAEISNKDEKFETLVSQGRKVLSSAKNPPEVKERLKQLTQERMILNELWDKRNKQLKQSNDLQVIIFSEGSGIQWYWKISYMR